MSIAVKTPETMGDLEYDVCSLANLCEIAVTMVERLSERTSADLESVTFAACQSASAARAFKDRFYAVLEAGNSPPKSGVPSGLTPDVAMVRQ